MIGEVDVSCDVCSTSATVSDCDPVGVEHVLQTWTALHAHSEAERDAWRASVERLHRFHGYDDDTDDE